MIKADITAGFLGAGKTTFIKALIKKCWKGQKIVLIENEFGAVSIDSRFMRDAGVQVTEMNSGCICCTLVGDFAKALQQVAETYAPDRIIIEPSGVAKLSEVAEAVQSVPEETGIELGAKITVVDGKKAAMYLKNFNEFYKDQIHHADAVVISRTQGMEEAQIKACTALIRDLNQDAAVITTPWDKLDGTAILDAIGQAGHGHHGHTHEHRDHDHHDHDHHDHHHADELFDSWGIETVHRFSRSELEDILKILSMTDDFGSILRAKGMVEGENGTWIEFDMVPEEVEIRTCSPDYTGRLCVIGTELDKEALEKIFGK